jgi:hypothetical protein
MPYAKNYRYINQKSLLIIIPNEHTTRLTNDQLVILICDIYACNRSVLEQQQNNRLAYDSK